MPQAMSADTPVGARIGDWIIDHLLGKGTSSTVYACRNARSPRIVAAIKVLDRDAARIHATERRFVREAELLFGLDHPNIVRVRSLRLEAQPPHLELELVRGRPLSSRLMTGALPLNEALRVFAQLVDAIAYLHSRGIHHRDIKPDNLILTDTGRLKLVDFGLARDVDASRITGAGTAVGTVSYVPPEWGTPNQLDPTRWDLYACGLVLHEMLTGRVAFPMPIQGTLIERALAVLRDKQEAGPLDPGKGVPGPVRAMIRALTHPDRDKRPSSAAAVLREVETWDIDGWQPAPRFGAPTEPIVAERRALPTFIEDESARPPAQPVIVLRDDHAWYELGRAVVLGFAAAAAAAVLGFVCAALM